MIGTSLVTDGACCESVFRSADLFRKDGLRAAVRATPQAPPMVR